MRFDFHTHVLPAIDDGSGGVEESLAMLRALASQGVTHVAATSHFYADRNSPEEFVHRRQKSWERLRPHLTDDCPKVLLGAEVFYYEGLRHTDELPLLCLENTRLLLLEMPTERWSQRMISALLSLNGRSDIQVVLAHFERYLPCVSEGIWDVLLDSGILIQTNASFLCRHGTRKAALKMLSDGMIHFLGTDCHNMTDRAPNMASALKLIRHRLGEDFLDRLERMEERLWNESKITMDSGRLPVPDRGGSAVSHPD